MFSIDFNWKNFSTDINKKRWQKNMIIDIVKIINFDRLWLRSIENDLS